jgi:hypothetical protein
MVQGNRLSRYENEQHFLKEDQTNIGHSMRCKHYPVDRIAHPPHHRRLPPLHGFCRFAHRYAHG